MHSTVGIGASVCECYLVVRSGRIRELGVVARLALDAWHAPSKYFMRHWARREPITAYHSRGKREREREREVHGKWSALLLYAL